MNAADIDTELKSLKEREAKLKELLELRAEVARLEWKFLSENGDSILQVIVDEVCSRLHIPLGTIMSKTRVESVARSRQIIFFLARSLKKLPYERIGKAFGKDHGTIMYGYQRIQDLSESDPGFGSMVSELSQRCESRFNDKKL